MPFLACAAVWDITLVSLSRLKFKGIKVYISEQLNETGVKRLWKATDPCIAIFGY